MKEKEKNEKRIKELIKENNDLKKENKKANTTNIKKEIDLPLKAEDAKDIKEINNENQKLNNIIEQNQKEKII